MSEEPTRRDLLRSASTGLAAVPILGGAYALAKVAAAPVAATRPQQVALCRLEEIPEQGFAVRKVHYTVRRGPVQETVGAVVFVSRDPQAAGGVRALSGRCPHLGCTVTPNPEADGPPIVCPCHDAAFDAKGAVLSGPPRENLTELALSVPEDPADLVYLQL